MAVFKIIEECWKRWWKISRISTVRTRQFSVKPETLLAHMSWTVSVHVIQPSGEAQSKGNCILWYNIHHQSKDNWVFTTKHTRRQWNCRCQELWEDLNNRRMSRGRKVKWKQTWHEFYGYKNSGFLGSAEVWRLMSEVEMDCKLEESQCVYGHACTDKICLHNVLWQISQPFFLVYESLPRYWGEDV